MTWLSLAMLAAALALFPVGTSAAERMRGIDGARTPDLTGMRTNDPIAADPHAVPATFDLFAACLRAGLPVATAAEVVAPTAPAATGRSLRQAADLLTLGADATTAWESAAADPATEALARIARRSARSGASLSAAVTELAAQHRGQIEDRAAAAAERAGVLISGPLGLCFLPAFICLGIVPVVIGLASEVLGGGLL
ncbi:MAG: type II secretion system F family protein [Rhodococcus sp.]|nr:type II secretion system F family protein [Rhodococcus sp. (in: high G+C Gram-positive bacteria)]